jgi:hypothetical protein
MFWPMMKRSLGQKSLFCYFGTFGRHVTNLRGTFVKNVKNSKINPPYCIIITSMLTMAYALSYTIYRGHVFSIFWLRSLCGWGFVMKMPKGQKSPYPFKGIVSWDKDDVLTILANSWVLSERSQFKAPLYLMRLSLYWNKGRKMSIQYCIQYWYFPVHLLVQWCAVRWTIKNMNSETITMIFRSFSRASIARRT